MQIVKQILNWPIINEKKIFFLKEHKEKSILNKISNLKCLKYFFSNIRMQYPKISIFHCLCTKNDKK